MNKEQIQNLKRNLIGALAQLIKLNGTPDVDGRCQHYFVGERCVKCKLSLVNYIDSLTPHQ
ncbi:MAG TPA: hypothetical protein ENH65_13260 [Candidatus Aminicenantes bacterium]|nr:hypothetical protein [Candidatus Aminicenantes bacterium]